MSNLNPDFTFSIEEAKNHQYELLTIYKSIISLVNDLRARSKIHMNQISDLEDGLSLNTNNSSEEQLKKENNILQLTEDINQFNSDITAIVKKFETEFAAIIGAYEKTLGAYSAQKGELSALLRIRKELIYLEYSLRKFKNKITSLQQMNNVLFSFSNELMRVKSTYRNNLSNVNASITYACDKCYVLIEKIQAVN